MWQDIISNLGRYVWKIIIPLCFCLSIPSFWMYKKCLKDTNEIVKLANKYNTAVKMKAQGHEYNMRQEQSWLKQLHRGL